MMSRHRVRQGVLLLLIVVTEPVLASCTSSGGGGDATLSSSASRPGGTRSGTPAEATRHVTEARTGGPVAIATGPSGTGTRPTEPAAEPVTEPAAEPQGPSLASQTVTSTATTGAVAVVPIPSGPRPTLGAGTMSGGAATEAARTATATVTATPSATSVTPTAAEEATGASGWGWLLLVGVAGVAGGGYWFVRGQTRLRDWDDGFVSAVAEVSWASRLLIPQLTRVTSAQQLALTAGTASARLDELAAALARLEVTAPDDERRARVQMLGDALRRARSRVDAVVDAGETADGPDALWVAADDLETALASVRLTSPRTSTAVGDGAGQRHR